LVVGVSLVVLVTVIGVVVAVNRTSTSPPTRVATPTPQPVTPVSPVDASTQLVADRGAVVFTDDFSDPLSGWRTVAALGDPGTSYVYVSGTYTVHGNGNLHHFAESPYGPSLSQIGVSMTATQTAGAPAGAGFGVLCSRGLAAANLRYEFFVLAGPIWVIERGDGAGTVPVILKKGSSPVIPATSPLTVVGLCATEADGQTNRLALFINGKGVGDITDAATSMPDNGWHGGLAVASRTPAVATVTVSHVTERDLTR
jgi:hypothetical protein